MNLTDTVTTLPGIGSIMAAKLRRLGISTVFDLLYHLPFRYEDRRLISPAARVQIGETVTVVGCLSPVHNLFTKKGKRLQTATLTDDSGSLSVIWFNQMYLSRVFAAGDHVTLYGKVDFFNRKPTLISPEYEKGASYVGLVPIYPETAGLSSKWLRAKIFNLLTSLPDISPLHAKALHHIHFPKFLDQVELARKDLAFDELFLLQLAALQHRQAWRRTHLAHPFTVDQDQVLQFISRLPFTLTAGQSQAIKDVLADLSLSHPANRLLEGDVGSGKTVVAAVAAYVTRLNSYQTLVLAPTQILAHQHHLTLSTLFKPFGIDVGLVTSQSKITTSKLKIVVGTHALLSQKHQLDSVGLVVIDEQHRFGVAQRSLAASLGQSPHILTMTATPIPRSLALTLYGDLDLSVLTDLPSGRLPVKTWIVPESKRTASYKWITDQLATGTSQCFWVCPFIDASESAATVKAVTTEFTKLQDIFPHLKLGLLHGKMPAKQKNAVITAFRAGELNVLVSTPIVEVGLDIPAATIMVIEGADRFGLAQLHQLRGRVGRGHIQSYCLLFTASVTPRLKAMETISSGSQLAEIDFRLRGPGDIYGTSQHGAPRLKVATGKDLPLIQSAKTAAEKTLPDLATYPLLLSLVEQVKISYDSSN